MMQVDLEEINRQTDWFKCKVNINFSARKLYPRRKEIWWVSLGQNIGVEINGKHRLFERPVLIFRVFNSTSAIIIPISSKPTSFDKYSLGFTNNEGRLNYFRLSQVRVISTMRLIRKIQSIDDSLFDNVRQALVDCLIKTETPPTDEVSSELSV